MFWVVDSNNQAENENYFELVVLWLPNVHSVAIAACEAHLTYACATHFLSILAIAIVYIYCLDHSLKFRTLPSKTVDTFSPINYRN